VQCEAHLADAAGSYHRQQASPGERRADVG
jgi:hypothetical protein